MAAGPPMYPRWALYLAEGKKIPYKRHWVRRTHPLALADNVRRHPQYLKEPECITEMSLMMACWKQNEFSDIACAEEIQTFLRCSSESEARYKEKMKREAMGQTGHFNLEEVNQILKEFPNIKKFS